MTVDEQSELADVELKIIGKFTEENGLLYMVRVWGAHWNTVELRNASYRHDLMHPEAMGCYCVTDLKEYPHPQVASPTLFFFSEPN